MTKQEFLATGLTKGLIMLVKSTAHSKDGYWERLTSLNYDNFSHSDEDLVILHPLTDLTKPIEHKGGTFIPVEELFTTFGYEPCDIVKDAICDMGTLPKEWCILKNMPFILILKLIEWHFDIAELIEKNEAMDVNTLTENPYK